MKPQKGAPPPKAIPPVPTPAEDEIDPDDPMLTLPLPRYNAMLAVLRNTLYMCVPSFHVPPLSSGRSTRTHADVDECEHSYGGIFEKGSREYTLDDFYTLPLDKLDRYVCLKQSEIVIDDKDEESSDDDEDDDGEDEDDDSDDDETQRDEMDSVTVVGDDEEEKESEIAVLDTIQEEKVRPHAALDQR